MKISYEWLCELVDVSDISPQDLAERLTRAGVAVDGVETRAPGVHGVVVGEVRHCEPHPNADKLRVCQVDVGQGELLTIVCGAPNVTVGMRVPVACVGATLPGDIQIGKAKLRGIESAGMLCSAKELGLEVKLLAKEQTEGLYRLPDTAEVGTDITALLHLNDVILELDLTPNRSDCLSMRGVAYEVAALYDRPLLWSDTATPEVLPNDQPSSPLTVCLETPKCARYEAQVLTSVERGDAPLWMQMRLMTMGIRPIDCVVDVTNYVMLEWGQPLHAFDFDQVRGETIVVRQARNEEKVTTLDGAQRSLQEDTIVIADTERTIGIAGVMGGENSEITNRTSRVVLESAQFEATSVRRAGQRLGLRSEAQQRFEKGTDAAAVGPALARAMQLLQDFAGAIRVGAKVAVSEAHQVTPTQRVVEFAPATCNRMLGTDITASEMRKLFLRLGLQVDVLQKGAVAGDGLENWLVTVPSRRPDITIPVDLYEEVGRLYGYDAIPSTLPVGPTTVGIRNASQLLRKRTRDVLMGLGLAETVTYTFSHPDMLSALRLPETSPYRQMIPLLRPLSEERTVLRTHMLPGLAQVAAYNQARGIVGGQVFEIGRVFWPTNLPLTEQPCERTQWAGLWFGESSLSLWEKPRPYDFYDVKGSIETWLESLGLLPRITMRPQSYAWLHPGRSAQVLIGDEVIGSFGALHPETAAKLDLNGALYAEFDLDVVGTQLTDKWRVRSMPRFPSARRDLAVIVPEAVSVSDLLGVAERVNRAQPESLLEDALVFDVYAGKGVPDGHKSIAIAFRYRAEDRTLTDAEIVAVETVILTAWQAELGAVLRAV